MAHYDLQEQEQISNLKYFWQKGGKYIIGLVVLIIIAYIGNTLWNIHKQNQAAQAATVYALFEDGMKAESIVAVMGPVNQLQTEYPKTEYAAMASLEAAKFWWTLKNESEAMHLLNWVIDNAADKGLISIARIHLADAFIDQNNFTQAMDQLQASHEAAFDFMYYMKRGDLYVVKGQADRARDAYKEALAKVGNDVNLQQMIQMRIDVLGNN
ncbi:MAG: tetratricopeptide repeat protein [Burkholderiales bacterium]|jgi:predicted negative regulator of RcsB-dependent stress response|nr:tetratricopeptide repeat protein [Burkholderiales bacterium]